MITMEHQPETQTPEKKEIQAITPTTWEGWVRERVGNAIISTKKGYYRNMQKGVGQKE